MGNEIFKEKQKEFREEEMRDYLKYLDIADDCDAHGYHDEACTFRHIAQEENMHAFLIGRMFQHKEAH